MATETKPLPKQVDKQQESSEYRSVSRYAVFSLVLSILSLLGLLLAPLMIFGLVAAGLGLMGLASIRRYPTELTGKRLSVIGITVGIVLFVAGVSLHTYVYMTEVPEGYTRISYVDLQPERDSRLPVSQRALELNGKKVFIKGYVHPGVDGQGFIENFVLVRDMGTCCFGGQPELTDMIEVTLTGKDRIKYNTRRRKLAGTLIVSSMARKAPGGLEGGYYKLEAEYLK